MSRLTKKLSPTFADETSVIFCHDDPSMEQIRRLTTTIREGWSERTRHSRDVAKNSRLLARWLNIVDGSKRLSQAH